MQPSMQNQAQGGNPALAQLFRNNAPTAPGAGMPAQLPQIMAPQRPNIGMPVRTPMVQPQAQAKPLDPRRLVLMDGQWKPAYKVNTNSGQPSKPSFRWGR